MALLGMISLLSVILSIDCIWITLWMGCCGRRRCCLCWSIICRVLPRGVLWAHMRWWGPQYPRWHILRSTIAMFIMPLQFPRESPPVLFCQSVVPPPILGGKRTPSLVHQHARIRECRVQELVRNFRALVEGEECVRPARAFQLAKEGGRRCSLDGCWGYCWPVFYGRDFDGVGDVDVVG